VSRKYFSGEKIRETPSYVLGHILAKNYGWTIGEIRSLDLYDFFAHVKVCSGHEISEKEFQLRLAGSTGVSSKSASMVSKGSGPITYTETQRFDPNVGDFI